MGLSDAVYTTLGLWTRTARRFYFIGLEDAMPRSASASQGRPVTRW